jgi:hypothetical protein
MENSINKNEKHSKKIMEASFSTTVKIDEMEIK